MGGGRIEIGADRLPYIHPAAESLDEALAIEPGPNPDLEVALRLHREVAELSGCADLGFKTPDFQGVLSTAALVLRQESLLMAMLEDPGKVHAFLDRVYRTNIAFMRALQEEAGRTDGNIWPYVWLPDA